ncbi:hypothetical protein BKA82DRAFT_4019082 [Pisolithus tinctorius]|nr:hypothetical protein BKA82DRAFT_4019082 [Pisolithus tinctorius]
MSLYDTADHSTVHDIADDDVMEEPTYSAQSRFPFLWCNVQKGFKVRCKMLGINPVITGTSHFYHMSMPPPNGTEEQEVASTTSRTTVQSWSCVMCDLHVLHKHLSWDHPEINVKWNTVSVDAWVTCSISSTPRTTPSDFRVEVGRVLECTNPPPPPPPPHDDNDSLEHYNIWAKLLNQKKTSSSAGGESKWEEPNLPDIPKPHSVFVAAWREADKNLQRVSSGLVDPGYRFPKPTLFVNVSTLERKKIYLFNWLSAHALWISQVDLCLPSRFPSPQMWRDFLNTIDTDPLPSTQTPLRKSAVWDILGEGFGRGTRGNYMVKILSLSNPPLWFIWSLLWELYELNFRYELYVLDWALVPNLWTSSDEMWLTRQTLLYSIFPGESSLVMWSESLPQDSRKLGLCATDVLTALPYINKFCHLLSAWPGVPARLQYPVEMKDQDDKEVYAVFSLSWQLLFSYQMGVHCPKPQKNHGASSSQNHALDDGSDLSSSIASPSTSQMPSVTPHPLTSSDHQASFRFPPPLGPPNASASTSQLESAVLNSLPLTSSSDTQVMPSHLLVTAGPMVASALHKMPMLYQINIAAHLLVGLILHFNEEVSSPLGLRSLQKRQNQWQWWSQDVIPALLKPYLWYLQASQSLQVVVDPPAHHLIDLRVLEFMRKLFVWLTPNPTAWCEALESFLDAQGYKLQSKYKGFLPCNHQDNLRRRFSNAYHWTILLAWFTPPKPLFNKTLGLNQVTTYVLTVHYVLEEKRTNKDSAGHDPSNPTNTVFIPESEVKAMEIFIEKQRSLPSDHHHSSHQKQGDSFEDGMRVPISVLDGCGDSFHAADEKCEKASTCFFADTGLMALLCHHDHVLWLVNMTSAGEKQHYALVLLKHLFEHLPTTATVGLLYDIGCQLERSCCKWKLLDEGILSRLKFGISVFHAYGHQWPCQIYHQRLFVLDNQIRHFDKKSFTALGQWLNKKWSLCKSKKTMALGALHALHVDMQTLQEEWAAQVHSQTQPLPRQSKKKGAEQLALILALEKSVQNHQSHVDQLEMNLHNDCVNDIIEFNLQLTAAQASLSKATQALRQKKSALGVSAQTDLYLLRNNKERLCQCKFEFERLEQSSKNSINAPPGAISPFPILPKGIFQLEVDSDIWQDVGLAEGCVNPPSWLADEAVHKGIRLMLEVDRCNEEERRLSREWSALQEWFSVEWQSVQVTLEHADKSYKYHLQSLRDNLVAVYVNWEAKVQHIPHAWIPSRPWGPRAEEIAGCLVAANNSSVISAAEDQTEGSLKDYDSDGEGLMLEGGDNLLLSIEEMALEEEYSMGEADEEQSTEDEEWLQDIENGYLPSSPVKLPLKRWRY